MDSLREMPASLPGERQREMRRLVEGGDADGEFLHWLRHEPEAQEWVRRCLHPESATGPYVVEMRGASPFD